MPDAAPCCLVDTSACLTGISNSRSEWRFWSPFGLLWHLRCTCSAQNLHPQFLFLPGDSESCPGHASLLASHRHLLPGSHHCLLTVLLAPAHAHGSWGSLLKCQMMTLLCPNLQRLCISLKAKPRVLLVALRALWHLAPLIFGPHAELSPRLTPLQPLRLAHSASSMLGRPLLSASCPLFPLPR